MFSFPLSYDQFCMMCFLGGYIGYFGVCFCRLCFDSYRWLRLGQRISDFFKWLCERRKNPRHE